LIKRYTCVGHFRCVNVCAFNSAFLQRSSNGSARRGMGSVGCPYSAINGWHWPKR
jgi:formate hydrogenlyase subunit 6/NADH:ubiquinone oxidoreductase subunit I